MRVTRRRLLGLVARGLPAAFVAACAKVVGGSSGAGSIPAGTVPESVIDEERDLGDLDAAAPVDTSPVDRSEGLAGRSGTDAVSTAGPEPARVLTVIGRDGWHAEPVRPDARRHRIVRATVHHTAVRADRAVDMVERLRSHQAYHRSLGWPDLAYHLVIDPRGRVWEGRPLEMPGDTATTYDPTGHLLVCLEGALDADVPTAEALDALALVLAWGRRRYGFGARRIAGHRAFAATSCPGDRLMDGFADVVARSDDLTAARIGLRVLRGDAARRAARA